MPTPRNDRPRATGVRALGTAACRRHRAAPGDGQGLPAAATRMRCCARGGDRGRSAGPRPPKRLPLAHALADRGRDAPGSGPSAGRSSSRRRPRRGHRKPSRCNRSGWIRRRGKGYAQRGMRDLCRLLLERVPTVCLFVRPENRTGDPRLRSDRDAAARLLPIADLLIRLLRLACAVWVLRWAAQQFASYVTRHRPRTPNG